ncbi:hypothetical protein Bca52824_011155 [Brassica carinata]|uniref:TEX10-like TPR repeats domain-containing protein n=1 Tax=Brassica carinata TaxID=52824 RepID=A0A8X7WFR5_BRACI|nr:hypothetical protein Bca52824_011155 [Brassica carinata]
MVSSKTPAKKQQKIDFKKIKRKLGRNLPPPKNATNTEIKSKAIIIREQSVAADKDGFATSHKNSTLQELLRRITHPNAKVRKNALLGIQDIFKSHPAELQSNKYTIVTCLKGRICDDDKQVRTAFYKLFQTHIFPFCKEGDNQRIMVSLLMPFIFLAMADSLIDVRLMAFEFMHLVVEYYPPTFSLYAEKILENYKDIIIQINHFYVQDKINLRVVLSGLTHCLSLLPCDESDTKSHKEQETLLAYEQDGEKESVRFAHVSGRLNETVGALIDCFQDFIPLLHAPQGLNAQSLIDCVQHIFCSIRYAIKLFIRMHTERQASYEEEVILDQDIASRLSKKLLGSFPLNPGNNLSQRNDESYFILNSMLTEIFWKFLEFVENTLLGKVIFIIVLSYVCIAFSISCWPNKLPPLLNQLGDKHPVSSQVVLKLLLDLGRVAFLKKVSPTCEGDVIKFFNPYQGEGDVPDGGPFVSLPREVQELALCFLYYFTIDNFSSPLLRAIVSCCLYEQLEPDVLYRILGILHDSYGDGYIPITDHFIFFITLIARFRVVRGGFYSVIESEERRETTFKELTKLVCSYLSTMGDRFIVLQIIEKVCVEQITLKPALDNGCGILKMICKFDSKPTRLSQSSVTVLSLKFSINEFLPGYCPNIIHFSFNYLRFDTSPLFFLPVYTEDKDKPYSLQPCFYYLEPCISLFDRSSKLTEEVLKRMRLIVGENTKAMMESSVQQDRESSRNSLHLIQCIVSVILLMDKYDKDRTLISPYKSEIDLILQNVITLQSSSLTVEGKHMMKSAGERLRMAANSLVSCATLTME